MCFASFARGNLTITVVSASMRRLPDPKTAFMTLCVWNAFFSIATQTNIKMTLFHKHILFVVAGDYKNLFHSIQPSGGDGVQNKNYLRVFDL